MREPRRGMAEAHAVGDRRRPGSPYLLVLSIPTMWWVIASGALHNFNMYALGSFIAPFLVRFHRMNFLDAGWVTAAAYGFSGVVGLVGGGALADRLYRRRVDGRLLVGMGSIVICSPLMFLALMRPSGDIWAFALLMGTACGVMYAYYATVYSTIHDVVEPSLRGTAMALYFCAMYLLGASLGPVGTGLASDYFTFQAASAAGAVQPLPFGDADARRAARSRRRVEGIRPARARAVPSRRACTRRCTSCRSLAAILAAGALRGVADGHEGRARSCRRGCVSRGSRPRANQGASTRQFSVNYPRFEPSERAHVTVRIRTCPAMPRLPRTSSKRYPFST